MRKSVLVAAMVLVSAGAQADGSRNLSLGGVDKSRNLSPRVVDLGFRGPGGNEAVQETKTAELVSEVDSMWEPMPRGPEAETTKSIDRPPGIEMSRRSRMKAAGSRRRAVSRMARADVRRPHHQGWSAARIVATLHHHGIYW
jgi:hypothetical protein